MRNTLFITILLAVSMPLAAQQSAFDQFKQQQTQQLLRLLRNHDL